jgi:capsular polysaccharide biosynthesis protein
MVWLKFLIQKLSRKLHYRSVTGFWSQPKDVGIFKNIFFHPFSGLFLESDQSLLPASAFHSHKLEKLVKWSRSMRTLKSDCATTISHGLWNNYYHWYIDSIPRLYFLQNIQENVELFITQTLSAQEFRLLQALAGNNIKIKIVNGFTLVKAKKAYYLPFLSESCNAELPVAYLDFFRNVAFRVFPQPKPSQRFKLFISRAGSGRRIFSNQEEIETEMKALGYLVLKLEILTLSQQIYYFRFAQRVVASHGAGLTNLLYASQCSVFEIFHSNEFLGHYKGLCRALGLQYECLCLNGKDKNDKVFFPVNRLRDWAK